ncbi:hypothetical protein BN2475_800045 [Paraburkholderia ribeironis]|uniref:Uncharacterized protein n=1 Tax=Paraburkholderia ribeironis TaxID=1247936 RepID=A0A1N7SKB1_9BURK|nr:hypothetical protein BN2475_800045 [Paraburkholderia ribeironis]
MRGRWRRASWFDVKGAVRARRRYQFSHDSASAGEWRRTADGQRDAGCASMYWH